MNRWIALVVAIVAGAAIAFAASIGFVGFGYGFLWLYVFGDSPWPAWVDPALNYGLVLFGFAVWGTSAWIIWRWLVRPPRAG